MESEDLRAALTRIDNRNKALTAVVLVLLAGVTFLAWRTGASAQAQSIRVSELVVVDKAGTPRVRISGELPDSVVNGRPVPRNGQLAGIALYDSEGIERSGYGTFSPVANVILTLDGKLGQRAFFVADPDGNTTLKMWRGPNSVELRVDDGGARLNALRNRELVIRIPEANQSEVGAACSDYTALRSQLSAPVVMAGCRERMSAAECAVCLQ